MNPIGHCLVNGASLAVALVSYLVVPCIWTLAATLICFVALSINAWRAFRRPPMHSGGRWDESS